MSDDPRMPDHPETDHPPPDAPVDDPDRDDLGEPADPTDPLKRSEDQPGADPVTSPIPPG